MLDAESQAAIFAGNFNRVFGGGTSPPGGVSRRVGVAARPSPRQGLGRDRPQTAPQQPNNRLLSAR